MRARVGPWGLAGAIALVLGCEAFVARHRREFMTPNELDWAFNGRAASRSAEVRGASVLCLGDSMLKFGLSPVVMADRLGQPVYSLATLDGKPAGTYVLFKRAVDAGARPSAVLVDFQPECVSQPNASMLENRHWKALLTPAESLDLARTYHDPNFFARTTLQRYLPSFKCRSEVRDALRLAFGGEPNPRPVENDAVRRNRALNRGGLLLAKKPTYHGQVPPAIARVMFEDPWFRRPENVTYVRRFLTLAAAHKIPVYWVLPPNTPEAQSTRERIGLTARYDAFLRGVLDLYPGLTVVDARRSNYGDDLFVDPVHLDRDGAEAFSHGVADVLEGRSGEGRWVTAPDFGWPGHRLALEDGDQSKAAVRAAATRR